MTSTVLHDFKQRVESFLTRTGMSQAVFGRLAINDGSFVADMREGKREFRLSTIEAVDKFMVEYLHDDGRCGAVPSGRLAERESEGAKKSA